MLIVIMLKRLENWFRISKKWGKNYDKHRKICKFKIYLGKIV